MNDTLIEKLREHSAHLSKMDEDHDHGIMTTIRFEEIDLVGQACIKLIAQKEQIIALEEEMLEILNRANNQINENIKTLKFAAKLLSRETPYYSEMNEAEMLDYLIRMSKELK